MKNIEFTDKSAQKIYDSYIRRIRRTISVLGKNDREDVLMEFNSHIYEGIQNTHEGEEVEKLLKITQSLGDPEEVLKSLVAEKKLNQATRTFNPMHIFQAIFLNIKSGIIYTVFAILYIFLFGFGILMIFKIMNPAETGLFFENGKFLALGRVRTTDENVTEVLGNWFIPVMFFSALTLYIIITLILKITRKKKEN